MHAKVLHWITIGAWTVEGGGGGKKKRKKDAMQLMHYEEMVLGQSRRL